MVPTLYLVAVFAAVLLASVSADASSDLMKRLVTEYRANTLERLPQTGDCTAESIVVRKEWYALSTVLSPSFLANISMH
jgi:hypothetical protein